MAARHIFPFGELQPAPEREDTHAQSQAPVTVVTGAEEATFHPRDSAFCIATMLHHAVAMLSSSSQGEAIISAGAMKGVGPGERGVTIFCVFVTKAVEAVSVQVCPGYHDNFYRWVNGKDPNADL